MMLFVYDDHHHLLCIVLGGKQQIWTEGKLHVTKHDRSASGRVLPFQSEALRSAACLGYTDSAPGDMTSTKKHNKDTRSN